MSKKYTVDEVREIFEAVGKESETDKLLKTLTADYTIAKIKDRCYILLKEKLNKDPEKITEFANLIKRFNRDIVAPFFNANDIGEAEGIVILDSIMAAVALGIERRSEEAMKAAKEGKVA